MEAAFLSSFIYEFKSSRKQLQAIFGSGLETNLTFKMLLASSPVRFLKYFVCYFSFIFHQQSRCLLCAHQRIGIGFNELYTWDIQPRSSLFCVAGTNSSVCHSHSLMLFIYSFIYIPSLPPKRVFTPGLLNICVKKKKKHLLPCMLFTMETTETTTSRKYVCGKTDAAIMFMHESIDHMTSLIFTYVEKCLVWSCYPENSVPLSSVGQEKWWYQ